jgi:hypothetical protein
LLRSLALIEHVALVPSWSPVGPQLVPCLSPVCPLSVPCLSPVCPLSVPCLSPVCPLSVPCLSVCVVCEPNNTRQDRTSDKKVIANPPTSAPLYKVATLGPMLVASSMFVALSRSPARGAAPLFLAGTPSWRNRTCYVLAR